MIVFAGHVEEENVTMPENDQVNQLVSTLNEVQSKVDELQERASQLTSQLETLQSQQQSQPSSPQSESVDLSEVLRLATSIRDDLAGTSSSVQDQVSSSDTTGGAEVSPSVDSSEAQQPSTDEPAAPTDDGTNQEQTVIGEGGEPQ